MAEQLESRRLLTAAVGVASHIIVFHDDADVGATAAEVAKDHGLDVEHQYRHALRGMAAVVPEGRLNALQRDSRVAYVEANQTLGIAAQGVPTGVNRIGVDERLPGIRTTAETVEINNVDIAIIDTGIDGDHPDLNVVGGANFSKGNSWEDGNGHGTHVAGTAAARDNDTGVVGVAPGARLWAVRVLDNNGSGWMSDIIAGVDWVTQKAGEIEVANMSLGGQGQSATLRTALQNSVAAGVVYYVAAGNSDADVYGPDGTFGTSDDYIPASYPEVGAVSALADSNGEAGGAGLSTSYGPDDSFATFSNYSGSVVADNPVNSSGAAIDLLMPGVDIFSTWKGDSYHTISGTSMASPHAAGLAALKIAELMAANGGIRNYNGDKTADGQDIVDQNDVHFVRQTLIDGGMDQASGNRLVADLTGSTGEPDIHPEPLGWAVAAPAQDLAVTEIVAPSSVAQNDVVDVYVTVKNLGTETITGASVSLIESSGEFIFFDQPVGDLESGASSTLIFKWDTTTASKTSYTLTATQGFGDEVPTNDSKSTVISVEPAVTDVAIAITSSSTVTKGESVEVFVTVENVGNQTVADDFIVSLTDSTDGFSFSDQTVSTDLAPGATETLVFTWNTTTSSIGNHVLTARHHFGDDVAINNLEETTVAVTTASTSDMYVWDMAWSEKHYGPGGSYHDINILVDVNQDIDANGEANGVAEGTDGPAASATATFVLIHDTDGDGAFELSEDKSWHFVDVPTDGAGQMSFNVKFAPAGNYLAEVTELTHATLNWKKALDFDNPDTYSDFPYGIETLVAAKGPAPQMLSPAQEPQSLPRLDTSSLESPRMDVPTRTSQAVLVDAAIAGLAEEGLAPLSGNHAFTESALWSKRKGASGDVLDTLSMTLEDDGLLPGGLFG